MGHHEPPSLLIFVLCTILTILAFTYGAYGRICIKAKRSQRPPQPQRRIVRRRSHNTKEENSTLCRRYICNGKRKFICSTLLLPSQTILLQYEIENEFTLHYWRKKMELKLAYRQNKVSEGSLEWCCNCSFRKQACFFWILERLQTIGLNFDTHTVVFSWSYC